MVGVLSEAAKGEDVGSIEADAIVGVVRVPEWLSRPSKTAVSITPQSAEDRLENTHADFADIARVEVPQDEPDLAHHLPLVVVALLACTAEHADEDLVGCRSRVSHVMRRTEAATYA